VSDGLGIKKELLILFLRRLGQDVKKVKSIFFKLFEILSLFLI